MPMVDFQFSRTGFDMLWNHKADSELPARSMIQALPPLLILCNPKPTA